ncbi:MAG: 23S rRNA (adenine(2503)-C(2))-methyltransferase RlmN [Candidatus Nealsonbacteria bacterium CG_4_10_14_0_2_um_filter_38_17]|uniref:Probable dual-specificity RNA methyltransferase RlmN n=2 Tax=Candidatus Nealsoniibacteriota TaxID=1817911 RepID=A0A2M7UYR5_9BACT|nr:MAG: 23S rRNA (adenine(2503)-C(2))-methyltransferase RlmN [Candidatus Nealsonbacteria bacterium CG23_combo_of_CG06-09_8_20_14_all_38_19]PIZ89123.1 MAG: 23S rRNA (adenine(2503)-C(2))-methyltransferase RlmN [Candidatus Nealsonbacteria bacterium CG_4_10_14_0_2_um_filter_38_17]
MIKHLEKFLENEPKYRLKQVKQAIFVDLIENWNKATNLPKDLRQKLNDKFPLQKEFKTEKIFEAKNRQTIKVLFNLNDGQKIESVLMRHKDGRRTVCVSSQVGCAMGCIFCATGQQGFKRNLSSSEIVEQVLFFARLLKKEGKKITNIVFMGMGEPFLNYDNVLEAVRILNDKDGFNLGARNISISTCGIVEGIEKLANEKLQLNLAISLHAPNDKLRSSLMPINKIYSLKKVLTSVHGYIKKTNRKVMFEYLLIDEVNDSQKEAKELARIMEKPLYLVNLISFNPVGHSKFKPSTNQKIKRFKNILEKADINVTQRYRFGQDIDAACGQLSGQSK